YEQRRRHVWGRGKDLVQQRLDVWKGRGSRSSRPARQRKRVSGQSSLFLPVCRRDVRQASRVVHDNGTDHTHDLRRAWRVRHWLSLCLGGVKPRTAQRNKDAGDAKDRGNQNAKVKEG